MRNWLFFLPGVRSRHRFVWIVCLRTGLLCWCCFFGSFVFSQEKVRPAGNEPFLRYIPLPAGISRSDVVAGSLPIKNKLLQHTSILLRRTENDTAAKHLDAIVIFTDQNGEPILPDKERLDRKKKVAGRREAGNELTLTYDSPSQPWSEEQLSSLKTQYQDFYPAIKRIIGDPFFSITVNVRRDASLAYAGVYYLSLNEIAMRTAAEDVFCHELIHAFRDDYVMSMSTYEEGMTRATEVEVFNQLEGYTHPFDHAHSYHYDYFYEGHNRPSIGTLNGNVQANAALALMRYQVSSYVWAKAYIEDNDFLRRFQDSLFTRIGRDQTTRFTPAKLRAIVLAIKSSAEGMPMADWYDAQHILNASPTAGSKLYQRVSQYTVDHFERASSGTETPQGGKTVSWKILGYDESLLSKGSAVTNAGFGWMNILPQLPPSYRGRLLLIASVETPAGTLSDSVYRTRQPNDEQGVFGLVQEANGGTVVITPLDTAVRALTAPVVNGTFSFPELEAVRGRFRVQFTYPDGFAFSRIFTKDRSHYFLWLEKKQHNLQALPVRFVDFQVGCRAKQTVLQWTASVEDEAGFFEVQKKTERQDWKVVHRKQVQGDPALQSFTCLDPDYGEGMYRVVFTDMHGKTVYSAIQQAKCANRLQVLHVYPVPATNSLTLSVAADKAEETEWQIVDLGGKLLQKKNVRLLNGQNTFTVPIAQLPAGRYFLNVQSRSGTQRSSFTKQ